MYINKDRCLLASSIRHQVVSPLKNDENVFEFLKMFSSFSFYPNWWNNKRFWIWIQPQRQHSELKETFSRLFLKKVFLTKKNDERTTDEKFHLRLSIGHETKCLLIRTISNDDDEMFDYIDGKKTDRSNERINDQVRSTSIDVQQTQFVNLVIVMLI